MSETHITLKYFAQLREQAGTAGERLPLAEPITARRLYRELCDRYGFSLSADVLRPAVNGRYVDWETLLRPGDEAVFVPPVSGG